MEEALGSDANQHWIGTEIITNLKTHLTVFGRKHSKNEISETKVVLNKFELQPEQSVVVCQL